MRFEGYSERRGDEARHARQSVAAIADNIPFGQPILVGHHSERRARRDAERIQDGMRKVVRLWETSQYWTDRAAGAIRNAKYKERTDVRARRIKKLETDRRRFERDKKQADMFLRLWSNVDDPEKAIRNKSGEPSTLLERVGYLLRADWCGLDTKMEKAEITPEDVRSLRVAAHERSVRHFDRWIAHTDNRLTYERAMLADAGGLVADRSGGPEVGGAIRCWASPGYGRGWSVIVKVNKVSVSIQRQAEHGGRLCSATMPLDKIRAIMSRAEVDEARAAGRLVEADGGTGFFLSGPAAPAGTAPPSDLDAAMVAIRESLRAGVAVVAAPQLFPTPTSLAARMAAAARLRNGDRFLEPSAGTGNIIRAVLDQAGEGAITLGPITAVEINRQLAASLAASATGATVIAADFLATTLADLNGPFDRIVMNPPFARAADVTHVLHALEMLAPGGRLVAVVADGPKQRKRLLPVVEELGGTWEPLAGDMFEEQGTSVRAALIVVGARS